MNCKRTFKMFTGILTFLLLHGAAGGIGLSSAAQPAVPHAADSAITSSSARVAANGQLDSLSAKNSGKGWTCPMHAEVHKHGPGKCPICKMDLVKAKNRNG
ncbi:heavy metal-binding domain-containing protein [Thiobacillus denitrificans]|uniref:heavy metal-binding domain-containing protein n=1 Tax=Thiobacillus denitrificans TaxID=36861 RepID=UPI0003743EC5|nr:heavy metal-binding domain-containing protein [Thiobacillus denitrificans]